MAPPVGVRSPAKSATTGGAGERWQAQRESTMRQAHLPQRPAIAGGSVASGFTRPGAQSWPRP
eukprot:977729-Alexandrium_andersonii.AAC.1